MASEFLLCTDVERMLLHTSNDRRRSQEKRSFDYSIYSLLSKPAPVYVTNEAPQMSATITDLCSEPLFLNAYLSDEEEPSLSDLDAMSFSSGISSDLANSVHDEDFADDLEATLPELLAEECTVVKQECKHALAVKLVAVGRPKVIHTRDSSSLSSRASSAKGPVRKRSFQPLATENRHSRDISSSSSSASSLPATPPLEHDRLTPMSACTPSTPEHTTFVFHFDSRGSPTPSDQFDTFADHRILFPEDYRPRPLQVTKRSGRYSAAPMTAPPSYSYIPPTYATKPKTIARRAIGVSSATTLTLSPKDEVIVKTSKWPFALRKDSFGAVHHRRSERVRRTESMAALT